MADGLWHHSDFLKLRAGQTISRLGSGVTESALPLTAVLVLGAQASDMGWLLAAESAPVLLVGMFAGLWVDRFPRRRPLIGADLGRAALLACIPPVAFLGVLRLEHLLGRVNATLHVVERGAIPYGALAGGMLGDAIGLRPTLLVAATGIALGAIWAARSGLLRQR